MIDDKWTPGPRTVRLESYGARVIAEDGTPLGWHGRNGYMTLEQAHANAALDAAAPAMAEALRGVLRVADRDTAEFAAARAALALAEGSEG